MPARHEPQIGQRILREMRQRIVDGVYRPSDRLPTRAELVGEFATTPVTVQRVFDVLASDGFIVAQGRRGTFVCDRPPHLTHYGLVFPYRDRPERPWPRFWSACRARSASLPPRCRCASPRATSLPWRTARLNQHCNEKTETQPQKCVQHFFFARRRD